MALFPKRQARVWNEFIDWTRLLGTASDGWVFRGGLSDWTFVSSLDRACSAWGISKRERPEAEKRLVREFQRHPEAHDLRLDPDDYLGWFALMQHYGAPTRLLDWTYSPFVAALFALEKLFEKRQNLPATGTRGQAVATDPDEHADEAATSVPVVWALDTFRLTHRLQQVLELEDWRLLDAKKDRASFAKLFIERSPAKLFVSTETPLRLNERLSVQQGLFLCPGDVSRTWQENLEAIADGDDDWRKSFAIKADDMETAFTELRQMNISRRSLFPGLDGYASSIGHRVKFLLSLPV